MNDPMCIHSTATTPLMWKPVVKTLGLTAQMPANLGYPPNAPLPQGALFSMEDDLSNLTAQLPSDGPIDLIAHSYGGLLALHLTRRLGGRVRSLFLYEPVLFGSLVRSSHVPEVAQSARLFLDHEWFLSDSRGGSEEWLEQFVDYWNRPGSWARAPEPVKVFSRSVGWKAFCEVRAVFFESLDFEEYRFDGVDITLARGGRSPRESRAMVDELQRVNPHAWLTELPEAGHMAPISDPAAVAQLYAAHRERVAAKHR